MFQWFDKLQWPSAVLLHDLVMVALAWLGAYWLRFNLGAIPPEPWEGALWGLPVVVVVQGGVLWLLQLYRGLWRFASVPDLERILKAVIVGGALAFGALFLWNRLEPVPRAVPLLYALLLFTFLSGPRLLYRWFRDYSPLRAAADRVVIVGAGQSGELLVRALGRRSGVRVVGFVDPESARQGKEIQGVRVLGTVADMLAIIRDFRANWVVLALGPGHGEAVRQALAHASEAGVPVRTTPRFQDLLSGSVDLESLRRMSLEDLLGREPVRLNWETLRQGFAGATVLVTGGGGSIGSELCHQLLQMEPARLVVLENSEYNLYRLEQELSEDHSATERVFELGDIRDTASVARCFSEHGPDFVFHAAAYKHVPLLEEQVREAVRNNVVGTRNVAEAADRFGVGKFVFISSDKAVNPTNVMGATKRAGELLCEAWNDASATDFLTVRFGNVLGSAGSVVTQFQRQIECGGPVTITHPAIRRYFMTTAEACQLITVAALHGQGGGIYVLDMGEPVRIQDLAEQMVRLAGMVPHEQIGFAYIGLRPGEKMAEELFYPEEDSVATGQDKLLLARHAPVDGGRVMREIRALEQGSAEFDAQELRAALMRLAPGVEVGEQADSWG